METGRLDDGLSALTEALAAADEHEIRHYEPEMHRLRGELLLRQDHSNAAEAQNCFQRAIEIARKQSAKSLELRATMSLARLLVKQGRRDEARTMLVEIYGWFTEGFDTSDLKDAKALLDELKRVASQCCAPTARAITCRTLLSAASVGKLEAMCPSCGLSNPPSSKFTEMLKKGRLSVTRPHDPRRNAKVSLVTAVYRTETVLHHCACVLR